MKIIPFIVSGILCFTSPSLPSRAAPTKIAAHQPIQWPIFRQATVPKADDRFAAIQYLLRARGYKTPIDGVFGKQTAMAVRAFQTKKGLKADGIVGSSTFPLLVKTLKRGDKGDAVRALQTLLAHPVDHGLEFYGIRIDGIFGFQTEQDLHRMQTDRGLKEDGIAGVQTWRLLFSGLPNVKK